MRLWDLLLGTTFAAFGLAKLTSAYGGFVLFPLAHYALAVGEIALGLMIARGATSFTLWAAIVIPAAGIVLANLTGKSCGCLGTWIRLSRETHMMVASTIGVIAAMRLYHEPLSGGPKRGSVDTDEGASSLDHPDRAG